MSLKFTLKTSIISGLGLLCFLAQPAFAEVILQAQCRQGGCFQTKFIRKTASQQSATGMFYTIEKWWQRNIPKSYCSTAQQFRCAVA